MAHLHTPFFLLLIEQPGNHFGTDLPHPQLFRNDCSHPLTIHVQLIDNHSNSQAAISEHFLPDNLNIFLSRARGRSPLLRSSSTSSLLSLNLLCHSKTRARDIASFLYTSCSNFSASVGFFPAEQEISSLFAVRLSWCSRKNYGPKLFHNSQYYSDCKHKPVKQRTGDTES